MCKRVVALTFAGNIYLMKVCIPIVNFIYVGYLEFNTATIFVFAYPTHAQLQMNASFLILYPVLVLLEQSRNGSKSDTAKLFSDREYRLSAPPRSKCFELIPFLNVLDFRSGSLFY